jgi:hypothetical protein
MIKTLLLATLMVAGFGASQSEAPLVLRPGDARVAAVRLQPYKARWKETLVNALHQVIERGTWQDELRHDRVGPRDVLVRTIVVTQPDGTNRERYRIVMDARTLEPVQSEWSSRGLSYGYDYAGRSLRGRRVNEADSKPVAITGTLPFHVFDYYGGMMELFLAVLPRTPGARFTFPAAAATTGHDADQTGVHWPIVEIIGEETVPGAGSGRVKATRVEANTRYGFYKVWVINDPPYVVRTVLLLGPGGRITYELMQHEG